SGKRKIYMEGYELYPESEEIKERLENTANGLLNLGKNHHSKGNFNSAINYYNDILTMPEISNNITFLVKTYLDLAQENSLFNTEKEILELGKNEYTASGKRKIYIVGYDLYPESQEIKERLEYTAKGLLNLGKNHHLKGNFNSAINYYNDILTMPGISNHIKNEAFTLLNFAKDNKPYKSLLGKTIMLDPGHGGIDPGAVNNYLGLYEKNFNNGLTIRIANKLRELGANVIFTREPGEDKYIGLHDRTVIVNKRNPDLFLSIHHDSSTNKSTTGMSVHYSTYRPGLDTVGTYVEYNGRVYPFIREIKEWSDPVRKTTDPGIVILYNGQEKIVNIKDTMVYDDKSPTNVAVKSEKFANYLFKSLLEADYKNGYNYIKDHNLHVTRWTNVPSALIEAGYISNNNEALRVINPNVQDKIAQKVVEATKEYFK
ncbi:N-acetylmuramoyl-L-alanine amidase, partial [Senegalia massiliensis]